MSQRISKSCASPVTNRKEREGSVDDTPVITLVRPAKSTRAKNRAPCIKLEAENTVDRQSSSCWHPQTNMLESIAYDGTPIKQEPVSEEELIARLMEQSRQANQNVSVSGSTVYGSPTSGSHYAGDEDSQVDSDLESTGSSFARRHVREDIPEPEDLAVDPETESTTASLARRRVREGAPEPEDLAIDSKTESITASIARGRVRRGAPESEDLTLQLDSETESLRKRKVQEGAPDPEGSANKKPRLATGWPNGLPNSHQTTSGSESSGSSASSAKSKKRTHCHVDDNDDNDSLTGLPPFSLRLPRCTTPSVARDDSGLSPSSPCICQNRQDVPSPRKKARVVEDAPALTDQHGFASESSTLLASQSSDSVASSSSGKRRRGRISDYQGEDHDSLTGLPPSNLRLPGHDPPCPPSKRMRKEGEPPKTPTRSQSPSSGHIPSVTSLHSHTVSAHETAPAESQADESSQPPPKKSNRLTRRALNDLSWRSFFKENPSLDEARAEREDDAFIGQLEKRNWWMKDLGEEWLRNLPLADGFPEEQPSLLRPSVDARPT